MLTGDLDPNFFIVPPVEAALKSYPLKEPMLLLFFSHVSYSKPIPNSLHTRFHESIILKLSFFCRTKIKNIGVDPKEKL